MKIVARLFILLKLKKIGDLAKAWSLVHFMKFSGHRLILYRGIRRADSPLIEPIGRHWSTERDKAFPYGGKGPHEYFYVYEAVVNPRDVDWTETNDKTLGQFSYEREVVLKPGRDIKVLKIRKIFKVEPVRLETGWYFPDVYDESEVNSYLKV